MSKPELDAPVIVNRLYNLLQDICDQADAFGRNTLNDDGRSLGLVLECRKAAKVANKEAVPFLKANGYRWDGTGFSRRSG